MIFHGVEILLIPYTLALFLHNCPETGFRQAFQGIETILSSLVLSGNKSALSNKYHHPLRAYM